LKVPHPFPRLLYILPNGCPEIRSKDEAQISKHDEWMDLPPCRHESMMIDGDRLGTVAGIDSIYELCSEILKPPHPRCHVLMRKVIYSGSHCGDFLSVLQVKRLAAEVEQVRSLDLKSFGISSEDKKFIRSVMSKLARLAKVSLKIKKPIAF
jgi:hypothetical protein